MKILELEIENFRSLHKVMWKPGDINVIIGRNGSGKSNLLRLLELASASAKGDLEEHIISSGGMNALLWDGKPSNISFQFIVKSDPFEEQHFFRYEANLAQFGKTSRFKITDEVFSILQIPVFDKKDKSTVFGRSGDAVRFFQQGQPFQLREDNYLNGFVDEQTILSRMNIPLLSDNNTRLTLFPYIREFREQLAAWQVYQDIRTDRDAKIRQEAEVRGVKQVAPDGQNLINVIHTLYESADDPDFRENLDNGMRAAFGSDYKSLTFSPDAAGRVQLGIRWNNLRRVNPTAALSDGTLRFLFLLTVLGNPSPAPLIAIDQPETGLHPRMLPIIAEYAVDAARRTQIVFTTHSPEFLNAFPKTLYRRQRLRRGRRAKRICKIWTATT